MPRSSLSSIAADLKPKRTTKRKATKAKRSAVAKGRRDKYAVYDFKGEGVKMIRRTLYLTSEELDACQRQAEAENTSVTKIIRRCIRQSLKV